MSCACGAEPKHETRLPRGWKRVGEIVWCKACWRKKHVLRAISLPVAGPVDATWPELRVALRAAWGETTRCANWMATELYARDIRRQPDETKLHPMPTAYLYPEARVLFPGLASQTVAALEQQVKQTYAKQRYELLWTRERSLATFRYPVPLPIPSQGWRLERTDGGVWHVSARIGDRRWTMRLRGGPHFRRQASALEAVLAGDMMPGAMALYQVSANGPDHRNGTEPGNTRLMCKIPGWFPRRQPSAVKGVLDVKTTPAAFLIASGLGRDPWILHGDHIRRVIIGAARQQQALSDDLKAEKRRPKRQREGIVGRMGQIAERTRGRLNAFLHEASAQLAGYAARCGAATVLYDDSERGFAPTFPWHEFALRLGQKLEQRGIELIASGSVVKKDPEALAEVANQEEE